MPISETTLTAKTETSVNERDHAHDRQRADHRDQADQRRHRRRDEAAEDEQRQQHHDRHRDQLGALEVLGGDLVDVVVDGEGAGDVGLRARCRPAPRAPARRGRSWSRKSSCECAGQRDQHLRGVPVVADHRRAGVAGRRRSRARPRRRRPAGCRPTTSRDGGAERRVVGGEGVAGVDRDDVDRLVAEGVLLELRARAPTPSRVVEAALAERAEDAERRRPRRRR